MLNFSTAVCVTHCMYLVLKFKIDEVTVIRVTKSPLLADLPCTSGTKVSKHLTKYSRIRRTNIDRLVAIPYQIPAVECRTRSRTKGSELKIEHEIGYLEKRLE